MQIRALCTALKQSALGAKFGVAALPRHLRRRAGSHKPYHGHRFRPNAKLQGKRRKLDLTAGSADGDAAAAQQHEAAAVGQGSTMALLEQQPGGTAAAAGSARPFTNRRMRRQPALLQQQNQQSTAWTEASLAASADVANGQAAAVPTVGTGAAADAGAGTPGMVAGPRPRPRRLETHVWHAKRLAMEERYGWVLPAGAAGQGRGSRSFVHAARASVLMHDASYLCPLLLRGPWASVHSVLSAVLAPADSAAVAADWAAVYGSCGGGSGGGSGGGEYSSNGPGWEQEVMLHRPGQYPRGAICPAQLLVCPGSGYSGMGANGMDESSRATTAAESEAMQACLWVHPAAAAEAAAALRAAAAAAATAEGAAAAGADRAPAGASSACQVSITPLNLRRLELRGGAADQALAVALAGATAAGGLGSSSGSGRGANRHKQQQQQQQQPSQQQEREGLQGQHAAAAQALAVPPLPPALAALQHGDAVQLLLPDPHLQKPVALGSASASLLPAAAAVQAPPAAGHQGQQEQEQQPQAIAWDLAGMQQALPPLSEAEISGRRQQLRRQLLHLDAPNSAAAAVAAAAAGGGVDGGSTGRQLLLAGRSYCPAVVVRHDPQQPLGIPGWSLILPSGWVPPFWLAAAYASCKPAGQREWRWLHALQQQRCFPWDYPDTSAYAAVMQQQERQQQAAAAARPPGKQMLAAPPCPLPWQQLLPAAGGSGCGTAARAPESTAAGEGQQQQRGQAPEQQQQPMDVDPSAQAGPAAVAPVAAQAGRQLYIARSYSAMAAALHCGGGSSSSSSTGYAEGAGVQYTLQWRPRQPASASGSSSGSDACCFLEAAVFPIKKGTVAEGAAVCMLAEPAAAAEHRHQPLQLVTDRQQRRRQREQQELQAALLEAGGDPAALAVSPASGGSSASSASSGGLEVPEDQVQVIGYVLSEAPRGAPRRCGALAVVAAPHAWRLRSLQYRGGDFRSNGGSAAGSSSIEALVRNPASDLLYPVQLRLCVEEQVAGTASR